MSTPDVHDLDKDTTKISMRRFTALATETPDPTREPAEGDIYEVEDEENLPEDAKAQTIALFRNDEEDEDLPVHVWVVNSDRDRHTGLSDHEKIDRDEGMLFDWEEFGNHGLTMRDMSFPIDMVFLDERGYVQQIVERVQPENPQTFTSACRYALELPSGFCEKHEIDGDWRVFREVRDVQMNPDIVELDKSDDPIHFTNVGGDPFQDYEDLQDFCAELEEAGGEVLLGDEPWEHASGHHDRPVVVYGLTMSEVEEIWSDYEDDALAIGGPTMKQEEDVDAHEEAGEIVRVQNVHEAPDDVIVHNLDGFGLYYVYEDHTVERDLGKIQNLDISRFVRIWVRDKDDVPEGQELLEGDGPAGNEYYYYETIGNSDDRVPGAEGAATESDQVAKGEYAYPDAGSEDAPGEVQEAVERFRSVVPEDTKKQTPLLYWLLGSSTPAYKMAKEDADYQHQPKGEERCVNCEYYYEGADGEAICSQVRGDVQPDHWCRLWDGLEEGVTVHTEGINEDWYPITVIEAMAKQMDFELDIFRIVATEDMDMGLTSDLMAVGVDFPSHDVFVDWRTESWPDGEELDGPHVSIYSTMDDVRDVAQGEIEMITTIDPADGMSKQMETPPGVPNGAHYLGPDEEVPEGASTYQGPQGATYYVPESTDNPDRAQIEDFGGLTQTEQPQTPTIEVDKGDRKEFLGYMSSGHERINDALRGDEEMTDDIRRHIDVMGSYIEQTPEFDEPTEVYRGLTASPDLADRLRQSEGEQVQLGGFQSTSTNPQIANRFTDFGEEDDVPVMMNIQTQNGLPIDNTDLESGTGGEEQEVVLGHNWTYQIEDVQETDDGLLVNMEVVAND